MRRYAAGSSAHRQASPADVLIDPRELCTQYYIRQPDPAEPAERVSFGTSGHRDSPLRGSFNEAHVLAITQAICEFCKSQGFDGRLCVGKDSHALSEPAMRSALEVLSANGVETMIDRDCGCTPTPAVSQAILGTAVPGAARIAYGLGLLHS